jgi:hypothetical protein
LQWALLDSVRFAEPFKSSLHRQSITPIGMIVWGAAGSSSSEKEGCDNRHSLSLNISPLKTTTMQ